MFFSIYDFSLNPQGQVISLFFYIYLTFQIFFACFRGIMAESELLKQKFPY